ncbi:MAG: hypothetical protein OXT71_08790 [Acidobacteriota bacterium]|nr:hypothetical protein [Acidobacteriota bacterium]
MPRGVPDRTVTVGDERMLAVIVYISADRQMEIHEESLHFPARLLWIYRCAITIAMT